MAFDIWPLTHWHLVFFPTASCITALRERLRVRRISAFRMTETAGTLAIAPDVINDVVGAFIVPRYTTNATL